MSEAKHTPGPWHVHERRPTEVWARRAPVAMTVARPEPEDEWGAEEINARLIAASPDLLAACRLALAWEEGEDCGEGVSSLTVVAALRAAIEKAEGRNVR